MGVEENQKVVDKLGEIYLLPNEDPSFYTISDIDHARAAYGDFLNLQRMEIS